MSIFNKTLHPPLCSRKYCLLSSIPQQRAPTHSGAAAPCTETERANPRTKRVHCHGFFLSPLFCEIFIHCLLNANLFEALINTAEMCAL